MSTEQSKVPQELAAELREDFEAVDQDQDGRIDFPEFRSLMDGLEACMSDMDLHIGFQEIDSDHDGRINLGEFIEWRTQQ